MTEVRCGGVFCDTLGPVGDVVYSTRYGDGPSGCDEASWTILTDPNVHHPTLARGSRVELLEGPVVFWSGVVVDVSRSENGWTLTAQGLAREAGRYESLDDLGFPTTVMSAAVDAAIARGLPWTAPRPWPVGHDVAVSADDTSNLNKLSTLLDAWCAGHGYRWSVDADGLLSFLADPTSPSWIAHPGVRVMGVADDSYFTHLYVRYVASVGPVTYAVVVRGDDEAELRWGRVEESVDLAGLGLMAEAEAVSQANRRLAKAGPRMGWTNGLDVDSLHMTDMHGKPVHFSQVRAGQMLRIHGTFDVRGNLDIALSVDVVLAAVSHAAGETVIRLAPVGLVPRTLTDVLADVPEPREELVG